MSKPLGMDQFRRNVDKALEVRKKRRAQALNAIGNNHILEGSKRAPVLKGFLRMSIEKEILEFSCVIRVPVNSPASDYAVSMHEDYYNLGVNSLSAQERAGVDVGRKYLVRGREAAEPRDKEILKKYLSV